MPILLHTMAAFLPKWQCRVAATADQMAHEAENMYPLALYRNFADACITLKRGSRFEIWNENIQPLFLKDSQHPPSIARF